MTALFVTIQHRIAMTALVVHHTTSDNHSGLVGHRKTRDNHDGLSR